MTPTTRRISLTATMLVIAAASSAAAATRLTVTVRNAANQALLDGAVVCVGTSANPAARGRQTTSRGAAVFEAVPEGSWLITVWKDGFTVSRANVLVNDFTGPGSSRTLYVSSGSGSDPCGAQPPAGPELKLNAGTIAVADTPTITSFAINGGMDTMEANTAVFLGLKFTGPVTEYRVSEISDAFREPAAAWRPFALYPAFGGSVRLPTGTAFASLAATKRVYIQLRNGARTSNVASDTIAVVAPYVAPAGDAIRLARENGFQFPGVSNSCRMALERTARFMLEQAFHDFRETVCTFSLFSGRALAPGWRITGFTWKGAPERGERRPGSGAPAALTLTSSVPIETELVELKLSGPYGSRWQDAFAR